MLPLPADEVAIVGRGDPGVAVERSRQPRALRRRALAARRRRRPPARALPRHQGAGLAPGPRRPRRRRDRARRRRHTSARVRSTTPRRASSSPASSAIFAAATASRSSAPSRRCSPRSRPPRSSSTPLRGERPRRRDGRARGRPPRARAAQRLVPRRPGPRRHRLLGGGPGLPPLPRRRDAHARPRRRRGRRARARPPPARARARRGRRSPRSSSSGSTCTRSGSRTSPRDPADLAARLAPVRDALRRARSARSAPPTPASLEGIAGDLGRLVLLGARVRASSRTRPRRARAAARSTRARTPRSSTGRAGSPTARGASSRRLPDARELVELGRRILEPGVLEGPAGARAARPTRTTSTTPQPFTSGDLFARPPDAGRARRSRPSCSRPIPSLRHADDIDARDLPRAVARPPLRRPSLPAAAREAPPRAASGRRVAGHDRPFPPDDPAAARRPRPAQGALLRLVREPDAARRSRARAHRDGEHEHRDDADHDRPRPRPARGARGHRGAAREARVRPRHRRADRPPARDERDRRGAQDRGAVRGADGARQEDPAVREGAAARVPGFPRRVHERRAARGSRRTSPAFRKHLEPARARARRVRDAASRPRRDSIPHREAMHRFYLQSIAAGRISAFALTEPSAGSDTARIRTRATLAEVEADAGPARVLHVRPGRRLGAAQPVHARSPRVRGRPPRLRSSADGARHPVETRDFRYEAGRGPVQVPLRHARRRAASTSTTSAASSTRDGRHFYPVLPRRRREDVDHERLGRRRHGPLRAHRARPDRVHDGRAPGRPLGRQGRGQDGAARLDHERARAQGRPHPGRRDHRDRGPRAGERARDAERRPRGSVDHGGRADARDRERRPRDPSRATSRTLVARGLPAAREDRARSRGLRVARLPPLRPVRSSRHHSRCGSSPRSAKAETAEALHRILRRAERIGGSRRRPRRGPAREAAPRRSRAHDLRGHERGAAVPRAEGPDRRPSCRGRSRSDEPLVQSLRRRVCRERSLEWRAPTPTFAWLGRGPQAGRLHFVRGLDCHKPDRRPSGRPLLPSASDLRSLDLPLRDHGSRVVSLRPRSPPAPGRRSTSSLGSSPSSSPTWLRSTLAAARPSVSRPSPARSARRPGAAASISAPQAGPLGPPASAGSPPASPTSTSRLSLLSRSVRRRSPGLPSRLVRCRFRPRLAPAAISSRSSSPIARSSRTTTRRRSPLRAPLVSKLSRPVRVLVVVDPAPSVAPRPRLRNDRLAEPLLELSPQDRAALSLARSLRSSAASRLAQSCTSPSSASARRLPSPVLRECLALGADEAFLINLGPRPRPRRRRRRVRREPDPSRGRGSPRPVRRDPRRRAVFRSPSAARSSTRRRASSPSSTSPRSAGVCERASVTPERGASRPTRTISLISARLSGPKTTVSLPAPRRPARLVRDLSATPAVRSPAAGPRSRAQADPRARLRSAPSRRRPPRRRERRASLSTSADSAPVRPARSRRRRGDVRGGRADLRSRLPWLRPRVQRSDRRPLCRRLPRPASASSRSSRWTSRPVLRPPPSPRSARPRRSPSATLSRAGAILLSASEDEIAIRVFFSARRSRRSTTSTSGSSASRSCRS